MPVMPICEGKDVKEGRGKERKEEAMVTGNVANRGGKACICAAYLPACLPVRLLLKLSLTAIYSMERKR